MSRQAGCLLSEKDIKKMEESEDPEQPQEQRQQIATAAFQYANCSNSVLPLPAASWSDQGQDDAASGSSVASNSEKSTVEVAQRRGEEALPPRRHWWGDCLPHIVLLREALLSSTPDTAVLGPLHCCFSFYVTHLHNEVLSSTYARTMTLGLHLTRLESVFMWVGGWRPTSALVLVYSLMGIDIENALQAVSAGRDVGQTSTSSLLSPRQLAVMHSLQKHTQNSEMRITKKLTLLQMLIGDQDVLEAVLLDAASPVANDSSRFHQVTQKRLSRFRRLLIQAEELRLHTVRDLLTLLNPIQAARCGVALFEMCSALSNMGSTTLPTLPALTRLLSVALPTSPTPSAVAGETLVGGFGEPVVLDLPASDGSLNSYDLPSMQSDEPGVFDVSPYDSILNSSDVTLRQSDEALVFDASSSSNALNVASVLVYQSDETQILVPSCSNSSSSELLTLDSSRGPHREERNRSLSAILPLVDLKLKDDRDGKVLDRDEQLPRVGKPPGTVISNRLLCLSPGSSDVTIQSCSLESSEFGAYFEIRP